MKKAAICILFILLANTIHAALWTGCTGNEFGDKKSEWFGWFSSQGYGQGWLYHYEHEWLYAYGNSQGSIWFWHSKMGFLWTNDDTYPFLWSDTGQTWLFYYKGTGGWFLNFRTGLVQWRGNYGGVGDVGTVSGHVYFSSTTIPVSGVLLSIGDITYTTGADGSYALNNVPVGSRTIQGTKENYDPFSQTISVSTGGVILNIEMTSGYYTHSLSGNISNLKDEVIYGAKITVLNPDGQPSQLIDNTDATGHYQIPTVPQGVRTIRVEKQYYTVKDEDINIYNADKTFNIILEFAPVPPPENVVVTRKFMTGIKINWDPRPDLGWDGYYIYRSTQPDSAYVKISPLLATTEYTDDTVIANQTWYYAVSSKTYNSNESPLSNYGAYCYPCDTSNEIITVFGATKKLLDDGTYEYTVECQMYACLRSFAYSMYLKNLDNAVIEYVYDSLILEHDELFEGKITFIIKEKYSHICITIPSHNGTTCHPIGTLPFD